jgi:long-subunit fatty acid transport protein
LRIKNHHFVLNLSYNRNFDTYFKFGDRLADATASPEPNTFFERHGGINSINLGFGTRIYKQLSFGFSGNVYNGKVVTEEIRNLLYDTTLFFTDYQYLANIQVLDSTKYSGFNMTLGLLYTGESLRGGLMVRTPFNLKGEADSTLYRITTFNNVPIDNLTDTNYIDDRTSKIEIPLIVGLGAGYNVNENLLVAADVEYRSFSGKLVRNLDSLKLTASGEKLEFFSSRDPNWGNILQFRVGAEYLLNTPIGEMPVRAGFRNEALPFGNAILKEVKYEGPKNQINDSTRVSYIFSYDEDKITGYSFSLGTGLRWSQIILDIAYTYTTYKQKIYKDDIAAGAPYTDEDLKYRNYWKNHHLNFTFTGYF